jgi:hypothetical protein
LHYISRSIANQYYYGRCSSKLQHRRKGANQKKLDIKTSPNHGRITKKTATEAQSVESISKKQNIQFIKSA